MPSDHVRRPDCGKSTILKPPIIDAIFDGVIEAQGHE
jgi:hypothetical protein